MRRVRMFFFFGVAAIGLALAIFYAARGRIFHMPERNSAAPIFSPLPAPQPFPQRPAVHAYGDPSVSLEDVRVRVVHFVPRGEAPASRADCMQAWQMKIDELRGHLEAEIFPPIEEFHLREFSGRSRIRFSVYPRTVLALHERPFYEFPLRYQIASPRPLENIEEELAARVFSRAGDLYDPEFVETQTGEYDILLIVYGGPIIFVALPSGEIPAAALANDRGTSALVFAPIVNAEAKLDSGAPCWQTASIVYHELLHAMGVPEKYDVKSLTFWQDRARRGDIMGQGVQLPLLETHLGEDVKSEMGVGR